MISYNKKQNVGVITVSERDSLNTLDCLWLENFSEMLIDAQNDKEIKAILICSNNDRFCCSTNIKENPSAPEIENWVCKLNAVVEKLYNFDKPSICAVAGDSFGVGFSIALCCDFVLCSPKARFGSVLFNTALTPECGVSYLLPQYIGVHKSKEIIYTGIPLSAKRALDWGIVNYIYETEDFSAAVMEFAERISSYAPAIFVSVKKLLQQNTNLSFDEHLKKEAEFQLQCRRAET